MENLNPLCERLLKKQSFSHLAVAVVDFKRQDFKSFCWVKKAQKINCHSTNNVIFDLASLSKPLSIGLMFAIHKELLQMPELCLLRDHRAGLASWGLLARNSWRQQLLSYEIRESNTLYSDFSALRLMLEVERVLGRKFKEPLLTHWQGSLNFWKDLPMDQSFIFPATGYRHGKPISGVVHDPNAYVINSFCTHAGLFSDIDSLAATLLHFDSCFCLLSQMKTALKNKDTRFVQGWDTVTDANSLAGSGCSDFVFGHLGFTGTSIWIDAERSVGHIILSNATQSYWHQRAELQHLRREVGSYIWRNFQ